MCSPVSYHPEQPQPRAQRRATPVSCTSALMLRPSPERSAGPRPRAETRVRSRRREARAGGCARRGRSRARAENRQGAATVRRRWEDAFAFRPECRGPGRGGRDRAAVRAQPRPGPTWRTHEPSSRGTPVPLGPSSGRSAPRPSGAARQKGGSHALLRRSATPGPREIGVIPRLHDEVGVGSVFKSAWEPPFSRFRTPATLWNRRCHHDASLPQVLTRPLTDPEPRDSL